MRLVYDVAPEAFDDGLLFGAEAVCGLHHLLEVVYVGEEHTGIDEVFVYLVEVGKEHIAEGDKAVEGHIVVHVFPIDAEEREEHIDGVGLPQGGGAEKEVVYAKNFRREGHTPPHTRQFLAEKETRTAVGEDETDVLHAQARLLILDITVCGSYLPQKSIGSHVTIVYLRAKVMKTGCISNTIYIICCSHIIF